MLALGETVVPAQGMGAISEQLGAELVSADKIRPRNPVRELHRNGNRIAGVCLENGEVVVADVVIVATPAPEAARLTGVRMPAGSVGTTCLYFTGPASLYDEKKIVLNANPNSFVNMVAQMETVAPEYAPPGAHLISATILGVPDMPETTLYKTALQDFRRMWAGDRRALNAIACLTPLNAL